MDIRVHLRRVGINAKHAGRKLPHHDRVAERFLKRSAAQRTFHAAPVHEEILHRTVRPGEQRRGHVPRHRRVLVDVLHRDKPRRELLPEYRVYRAVILAVAAGKHGLPAVPDEPERYPRVAERQLLND